MSKLLIEHKDAIIELCGSLSAKSTSIEKLRLKQYEDNVAYPDLNCFYAPFEYINKDAKIVLIGITPGRTQMNEALTAASSALKTHDIEEAKLEIKKRASFSGDLRKNLINILNKVGYQKKLGIGCSSELWADKNYLVHFCSLLKYPVFVNDANYNGSPKPLSVPKLKALIEDGIIKELECLSEDAELIPLGDKVADVISQLYKDGKIRQKVHFTKDDLIISPPHPSPANKESINLLLKDNFPKKEEYSQGMYKIYKESKKKKETIMKKDRYIGTRESRWQAVSRMRKYYKIDA
jgi:hypothetical protein